MTPLKRSLSDTLIFHRLNDLACLWYVHTKRFAKLDRYTLGQQIFELFIKLLTLTARAQYQTGLTKLTTLRLMIPELDTIKILIRLSRKLEILNERAYIQYEKELHDIGKMLGGWIRNLENKQA